MIKKKMTPRAEELMIKALSRARGDGVDPNVLLNAVMLNGWQGIGNKENQYNGIIKNTQPTHNNRQYLNTSQQMALARKEFENGNRGTENTSTSQNVGRPALRSIQYSDAGK